MDEQQAAVDRPKIDLMARLEHMERGLLDQGDPYGAEVAYHARLEVARLTQEVDQLRLREALAVGDKQAAESRLSVYEEALKRARDTAKVLADVIHRRVSCSQCGLSYEVAACGPTHAVVAEALSTLDSLEAATRRETDNSTTDEAGKSVSVSDLEAGRE